MKTILAATDFSPVADNAIRYAAEIARMSGARLILYNVFAIPVPATDVPVVLISVEELYDEYIKQLEVIKQKILKSSADPVNIDVVAKPGIPADEIQRFIKEKNVDLVVMGITGMSMISELFIGSTSVSVFRHSPCPVLIIPEKASFKIPGEVVFASDFSPETMSLIEKLKNFDFLVNAKIHVLNIVSHEKTVEKLKTSQVQDFEQKADTGNYSLDYFESEDVVEGIYEYAHLKNAEMIIMVPHKHSFF